MASPTELSSSRSRDRTSPRGSNPVYSEVYSSLTAAAVSSGSERNGSSTESIWSEVMAQSSSDRHPASAARSLSSPQVLGERWAPLAGRKAGGPDLREVEDAVQGPRRGGLVGEVLRRAHPADIGRRPATRLENGGRHIGPGRRLPGVGQVVG